MQHKGIPLWALAVFAIQSLAAQDTIENRQDYLSLPLHDSIEVVPGAEFEANRMHRFLFGTHWRNLWTTPIFVPVLNLDSFAGGLQPIKSGGRHEALVLHLQGNDGRRYKYRVINKDPRSALPRKLRQTVVARVLSDQTSSAHPMGAVIAAPLLDAAGILHSRPSLFVMPASQALDDFNDEFAGTFGVFEEHPDEGYGALPGFAGASKIVGSFKLLDRMEEDSDNRIDQGEYLKARLLDFVLGDWDRHYSQWRWARFAASDDRLWHVIPLDRDHALWRFDGLFPWLATHCVSRLDGVKLGYPDILDPNRSARFIDRRLLSELGRQTWDSVARALAACLSDEVIEDAVAAMPHPWFELEGDRLVRELKERRDRLPEFAASYYRRRAAYVGIYASNRPEIADIRRLDDRRVEVSLFQMADSMRRSKGRRFYHRVFDAAETSEIRLYLLGGDDLTIIKGSVNSSIEIKIVGGEGDDELRDEALVRGHFLSLIPFIPSAETQTYFYDADSGSGFVPGPGSKWIRDLPPPPEGKKDRHEPDERDWGVEWKFRPWLHYGSDDGLTIGGGPVLYNYDFAAAPYDSRIQLRGAWASGGGKTRYDFNGRFNSLIRGATVLSSLRLTELQIRQYYGMGNESVLDDSLHNAGYYEVQQELLMLRAHVQVPLFDHAYVYGGGRWSLSNISTARDHLIGDSRPYGIDKVRLGALEAGLRYETRNKGSASKKGILFNIAASLVPAIFDSRETFTRLSAEWRSYLRLRPGTDITLATRVLGERVWGDAPFFEAVFLGGSQSLRGFTRERFAGNAAVSAAVEMRVELGEPQIVVPVAIGLTAAAESGRVFVDGESSDVWHSAVGGGIYLSFVRRRLTASASLMQSREQLGLHIRGGFAF